MAGIGQRPLVRSRRRLPLREALKERSRSSHAAMCSPSGPLYVCTSWYASACVVADATAGRACLLDQLQTCLAGHFPVSVEHSTFQLEPISHAEHEAHAHP